MKGYNNYLINEEALYTVYDNENEAIFVKV